MAGQIIQRNGTMIRPGVGIIIGSGEPPESQVDGVVGYVGTAHWGPLNVSQRLASYGAVERVFGLGGTAGWTMDGAQEAFLGDAAAVECVRCGTGGAAATKTILDSASGAGTGLKADAKYVGTGGNALKVGIRAALVGTGREFLVYESAILRETFPYAPGSDEAAAIVAAVAKYGSDYITVTALALGTGALPITAATALLGGTDPTVSTTEISAALAVLETKKWRVLATYVEDASIHPTIRTYIDRIIRQGLRRLAIIAQPTSVSWSTRITNCKSISIGMDPAVVYVGGVFTHVDLNTGATITVEGYKAAGREAGRHASLPLGRQLTHNRLWDGVTVPEVLTTDKIDEAITSGMYIYTLNPSGQPRTEVGCTSLSDPTIVPVWAESIDAGWSKSRLLLTRFRLLDDISNTWDDMIEDSDNTPAGRNAFIAEVRRIIETTYMPAGAVLDYSIKIHPDKAPSGDTAWFLLSVQTPDGLEKLILDAKFRR